jgi:predicted Zn-dependent protease
LPYTFRVLNASVPNAFALPGGFIVVNRGLLIALSSEGELAAVLGHEIGHATARHSVAAYQRALGLNLALLGVAVAGGSGATMQLSSIGAGLLQSGFSREQERESDYLGIDYMVKAKYDPRGAIDLQEYFFQEFEKGKSSLWIEGLFRTHPFSRERLENVKTYSREKYSGALDGKGYVLSEGAYIEKTERLREVQKAYDVYDEGNKLLGNKQKVDPELAEARVYLGIAQEQKGECGKAVVHLEKSMDLMPTKTAAKYLGKCYRKLGDREKAAKYEQMAK